MMRMLSRSTYDIYVRVLTGPSETEPYAAAALGKDVDTATGESSGSTILPSVEEVQQGVFIPRFGNGPASNEKTGEHSVADRMDGDSKLASSSVRSGFPLTSNIWYSLSMARSLTKTALLRFAAYCALFFTILGYPFDGGTGGENWFFRLIFGIVMMTGLGVALVGLFERVYWNGKVLWCFVPLDWGAPILSSMSRATGPFVDPDHFANYLAMSLPFFLVGGLFGSFSASGEYSIAVRIGCAIAALVVMTAILISLSRAGWTESTISGVIVFYLWFTKEPGQIKKGHQTATARPRALGRVTRLHVTEPDRESRGLGVKFRKTVSLGMSLGVLLVIISLALFLVGPQGRTQEDLRVGETVASGGGLGIRPVVWSETLEMIRAFPVFGMGLAAWPELFPHYQAGPWNASYFRQAHNDYLQFAAETGLIGIIGLVWFVFLVGGEILKYRRGYSSVEWPIFIALSLALGSSTLHEVVDFPLRIPANALLFTLLLALTLRIAMTKVGNTVIVSRKSAFPRIAAGGAIAAGVILMLLAFKDNGLSYPYDIPHATSPLQARTAVLAHPVSAIAHLSWLELGGPTMTDGMRQNEIAAAAWLDPSNPTYRDLYASTLARAGREKEALEQVRESVFNAPALGVHEYLSKRLIPWTSPAERSAVEQGFKRAIAADFPGAVEGLGSFYDVLGRLSDESGVYQEAAVRAQSSAQREQYLISAAEVDVRAVDTQGAEILLRRAVNVMPADSEPYEKLIIQVYGPTNNLQAAQSVVTEAVQNGVDATHVYLALASAAQASDTTLTQDALLKALALNPSFEVVMRVGQFYLGAGQLGKAESTLQNATEINPQSAEAFYLLGVAEERDYQYPDAEKAYARAASLAPHNYRDAYADFRRRLDTAKNNS